MKERFKLMEEKLHEINTSKINLLDLMVYDEITCQLEDDITDEQFELLFNKVENAYLKGENVDLWAITNYCIEHLDTLRDMGSWEICANC